MDNDHGYVPLVVSTSRSFPHSRLITVFVTRLTRRVPLVEQELLTLPEHLSSPTVFTGVRVTRSLVLYICFVDRCLSFCTFFLAIVLSVLRYTDSDCPFGIFKLFLRICCIVPKKYLLLLDQTISLHFRSGIDRPLNLPQYPGSNNYFSIPEEII